MTELRDISVHNPFNDKYEDCFCEFDLHIEDKRLVSSSLVSAISKADVELIDFIPLKEKADIEQDFEIKYREEMSP